MTIKPIIFSVLGAGAIGGLAVGGYSLLRTEESPKPKSLRQILSDEKVVFLTTENSKEWGQLITKFFEEVNNITKIEAKDIVKSNTDDKNAANIKKLQDACNSLLEKTEDTTQNKEIAKNWCTKSSALLSN